LFHDTPDYYSCFHLWEDMRHTLFTDKVEFHVLELPKLPEEWKASSDDRLLWAKFISSERKEDFEMLATKNSYLESAYQQLQIISQDKEKRLEYEARQKAILDYNQSMWEAEQRGREAGREEGEKIGRKAGREEGEKIGQKNGERIGRKAGEHDRNIQIARNMIKKGFDKNIIREITNLTMKEIDAL